MDPKKKLIVGILIVLVALTGIFLLIRKYTPQGFQASINQPILSGETLSGTANTTVSDSGSQQLSSGDTTVEQLPLEAANITIIAPAWIDTHAFQELLIKIENNYHVHVSLQTAHNLQDYKELLKQVVQSGSATDILLAPTNRVQSFSDRGYRIPFKERISPLFDPIFTTRVDHPSFSYIPYALDPMVTFYNTASYTPKGKTTFSDIQRALLTPRKTTSSYLPLLFGIDAGDLALLEQGGATYPGYTELLQLFVQMDISRETTTLLDFFLQTSAWNMIRFQTLTQALGQRVDSCQYRPHLCLLVYDIADVGFGRLHERTYIQEAFPNRRATLGFSNLPIIANSYPVTGWGRIINKESPEIVGALQRIRGYLEVLIDEEPTLHNSVFSPTNAVYQRQKIEDRYLPLAPFTNHYQLTIGSLTDTTTLIEDTPLLPVLRGEYSKTIFLQKMIDK